MTISNAPWRARAQWLGPMHLLVDGEFNLRCWRVLNLQICGSERVTRNDGAKGWHPEVWIWFAWSPAEPGLLIGTRPPTTFGVSVGQTYDAVLGVVGRAPVRLVDRAAVDEVDLLERALGSGMLEACCRWHVNAMLDDAKAKRRRGGW